MANRVMNGGTVSSQQHTGHRPYPLNRQRHTMTSPTHSAPGYLIGHITVKQPDLWRDYCAQVPDTLALWGASIVFRGQKTAVLNGSHPQSLTVVIRFPSAESVAAWHDSAAYQALIPLRDAAAEVVLLSYESLPTA